MPSNIVDLINTGNDFIQNYYMEIINAMPCAVYWVDKNCNLEGCNKKFKELMGFKQLSDFSGTPYEKMVEFAEWDEKHVNLLRLEDMQSLFTPQNSIQMSEMSFQNNKGILFNYYVNRSLLYSVNKEPTGLAVFLTDINNINYKTKEYLKKTEDSKLKESESVTPFILVVEDNILAQFVEKSLLTSLNCQVDIAKSEQDAVELFQPGKYDLVLMDIGLEGSSGYIVAKEFRKKEQSGDHRVPIIALTGFEADSIKFDCKHYTMEGAITKPLTTIQAEQILNHYVYQKDTMIHGLKSV